MPNELISRNPAAPALTQSVDGDLLYKWINYIDAKPKSVATYTRAIKQFLVYLHENGIAQPTRADIVAYRDHLTEGHKATTVQSYLMAVKLFFQWTNQEGLYPDIANHVKSVPLGRDHKKDYLTSKQVKKGLATIDRSTLSGKRDYAIFSLMVTSGLRTIEVSRANIEDIRTVADFRALFIQGKGRTEKADLVKLADPVEEAIDTYLNARGKVDPGEPLFASLSNRNKGGRMTTRSISRLVKDALIGAGFDSSRLTAHSLRHTAATLNLLNGGTVEETQQLLRHTNINTTLIYSHALERAKNNSEERVANAIFD